MIDCFSLAQRICISHNFFIAGSFILAINVEKDKDIDVVESYVCRILLLTINVPVHQSWAHRYLKSLNLERTLILGAMALNKKKSDEQTDKIQILSGLLMSDIRKRERCSSSAELLRPRVC